MGLAFGLWLLLTHASRGSKLGSGGDLMVKGILMSGKRWPILLGLVLTLAACLSPERQGQPETSELPPMFKISARRDSDRTVEVVPF